MYTYKGLYYYNICHTEILILQTCLLIPNSIQQALRYSIRSYRLPKTIAPQARLLIPYSIRQPSSIISIHMNNSIHSDMSIPGAK